MRYRPILVIIFMTVLMTIPIITTGCGSSSGEDSAPPSVEQGDSPAEDGSADPAQGVDGSADDSRVLITGALVGAEGVGIPDASIVFHSDPVQAITDSGGVFEALLEVGQHSFEVTADEFGSIAGSITVSAISAVDEAGQTLGSFIVDAQSAADDAVDCIALELVNLSSTLYLDHYEGLIQGAFGNEIDSQGRNQTLLIVGNSEMTANISIDGRLSGLWFPSVGAYNHIPYLSMVDDWVKPFQGSFGGVKRGDDYFWFTDRDSWQEPTIEYTTVSGTHAPIARITHVGTGDCSGATVWETVYVDHDGYGSNDTRANVLMREFRVITSLASLCATPSNSSYDPELAVYSRLNPNSKHQIFRRWEPEPVMPYCSDDRMRWKQGESPFYSIVMQAVDNDGARLGMSCTDIISLDEARRVVPDAECFPLSVMGTIAAWDIPATRRVGVATAGCGQHGVPCLDVLDDIEEEVGASSLYQFELATRIQWDDWLGSQDCVANNTWDDRCKRWLVSMKMLADRNTGAIIASPSQEPTYYYSWPRDGVFQALAFIMAGKYDEAASFFNYLFEMTQNWDGGWTQAHSSLDGAALALPDSPLRVSVEEDQPPTVLWGLWVYWKETGSLPDGISDEDIKEVANYIVPRICPVSGLLWPSLDRLENPMKHIGQSLYTNAAAYAGLLAAAEMVENADPAAAALYRSAAQTIKDGILNNLCPDGTCHTRIKYDPLLIPDLGNFAEACGYCLIAPYSDEEDERILTFAWPFHLFDLGDPLVQAYYYDTYDTHDDLNSFSSEKSLWIPRYLYSYLYAFTARNSSEVPAGNFKNDLISHVSSYESSFDHFLTDVGYLMDQYIGDNDSLGSAARPLGWSQAMGILVALARDDKHVPLIAPVSSTVSDCVPGSGPCCDPLGDFRPSTYQCDTDTEYACQWGTGCGDDVGVRTRARYCSGTDASCSGSYGTWSSWSVEDNCSSSEICAPGDPTCNSSASCSSVECTSGVCCNTGTGLFRPSSYQCSTDTQYACQWGTDCGDDVGVRTRPRYCSGASASCSGSYGTWGSWAVADNCSSSEVCAPGDPTCNASASCSCSISSWLSNTLTATEMGAWATLSWNAAPSWVDHYVVARLPGAGYPTIGDEIATTTNTIMNDFGGSGGQCYNYIVYAVNDCGDYRSSTLAHACID